MIETYPSHGPRLTWKFRRLKGDGQEENYPNRLRRVGRVFEAHRFQVVFRLTVGLEDSAHPTAGNRLPDNDIRGH